ALHVMVFEGHKRVPPFLIRPKAFGLPLPNVQVVQTDDDGRFEIARVREGEKTLVFGEEGMLLFGRAAVRRVEVTLGGAPLAVRLTEREMDDYGTLADRAERATDVLEDVL